LRDQEITPHKLQGIWNTLRWFSAKFGLLDPDSLERLKAKRKTIQEGLVETNIKPQRKAKLPSKEIIVMMERIAAGEGTTASTGASTSPKFVLDRYICAMARFKLPAAPSSMTSNILVRGLQTHRDHLGTPGMADKDS